jgi:hypothetical protein
MRPAGIVAALLFAATQSFAQAHDHQAHQAQSYSGMQGREIKALSAEEIEQLRSGAGMGLALAAELNGYPGPKHVLELGEELGLTDEQRAATTRAFEEMRAAAIGLGEKIIRAEAHLDGAFADGSIDEETLARITSHAAALRGELRAVHLKAHLKMKAILTAEQVDAYARLRGYE